MDRTKFIGGSDIASVLGESRWKTTLQLWAEKVGYIKPDDLSDNEAVEWGTRLEELVAKKFQEVTGKKVRRASKNYVMPGYEYMQCQVDRLVEGTDELLEVKTCNAWKEKEWDGEDIPKEYIYQVQWQLGITGRARGHIAVLIGGQRFKHKSIDFDKQMYDNMVNEAMHFWMLVQEKKEPEAAAEDGETLVKIHPANDDQMQAVEELNTSIGFLQELKMQIKNMEDEKKAIESKIKQSIGDHEGINTSEYQVTWKAQTIERIDTKRLKAEEPEIAKRFTNPTQTRVLRIRKAKEK